MKLEEGSLSKTEDYLDSLLNAVSDSSAGRVVKKESRGRKNNGYRRDNRYERRGLPESDKKFIDDFENELLMDEGADDDEFLKAFERELEGRDEFDEALNMDEKDSGEEETSPDFGANVSDEETEEVSDSSDSADDILSKAMDMLGDESEEESEEASSDDEGPELTLDSETENEEESEPEEEKASIEASLDEAALAAEEADSAGPSEEEPLPIEIPLDQDTELMDENVENSEELMDLLEDGASGDDELSEIGDLLKAVDEGEMVESEGEEGVEELEKALDDLAGLGLDDLGEDVVPVEAEADLTPDDGGNKKKKKGKDKGEKGEGFLAKLARILFGDDDEDEELDAQALAAENGIGDLTDENFAILEGLDAEDVSGGGKKEKKKKEKKPKEKKPKPKKEKKPKEKKPPKPKKEKKPIDPSKLDLSAPLPRLPMILIFIMGISFVVLVVVFTNLLDSSVTSGGAKSAYKKGEYVAAYEYLSGKELKGSDAELYEKVSLLAMVQSKYDDYFSLMYARQYDMAVDSLICAIGRFHVNGEEAAALEIADEYENLRKLIVVELENIGLTEDEAVAIYNERNREEYTKTIIDIVEGLGYTVD